MKRLSLIVSLAMFASILPLSGEAAMLMRKRPADPDVVKEASSATAPAEAKEAAPPPAEAKKEAPEGGAAPEKAAEAKEEAAPPKAPEGEPEVKKVAAKPAAPKRVFKAGHIGSVTYVSGGKALVESAEELPPKTHLVVYDERFSRHGLLMVGKSKGRNLYLATVEDGDATTGNRVSVETEEEAFQRVLDRRDPNSITEFLAFYPDHPRREELEKR